MKFIRVLKANKNLKKILSYSGSEMSENVYDVKPFKIKWEEATDKTYVDRIRDTDDYFEVVSGEYGELWFRPFYDLSFENGYAIVEKSYLDSTWEGVNVDYTPEEIAEDCMMGSIESIGVMETLGLSEKYIHNTKSELDSDSEEEYDDMLNHIANHFEDITGTPVSELFDKESHEFNYDVLDSVYPLIKTYALKEYNINIEDKPDFDFDLKDIMSYYIDD